jgi:hypothetical protein
MLVRATRLTLRYREKGWAETTQKDAMTSKRLKPSPRRVEEEEIVNGRFNLLTESMKK